MGATKKRNRKAKLPEIKIDREQKCPVDKGKLPEDAEFNGYEEKVVQDLIIKTDNVKFLRESYYSPSLQKTYLGDVPEGYEGEFGPHINSHIVAMKYADRHGFLGGAYRYPLSDAETIKFCNQLL
jgi:hypothetical protein